MGFFKKLGNALGIKSHTFFGKILNTDVGEKKTIVKNFKDLKLVDQKIVDTLNKKVDTSTFKNVPYLNTTFEEKKSFVGSLFDDMFGNVKDGVNNGVKNASQTLIDKLTGKLINSDGSQSAKNSISDYASGIMETTMAKYIKNNWFYILFPIIGLMIFAKVLFKNGNKRKPKYKR